jgi:curli production assembly/transport component CsgG
VVTHKTIASVGLQGGVFKFIAVDKILEAEAGFTKNEPEQLAVQQAIEKAVYALVVEGSEQGLWSFADKDFQSQAIEDYRAQQFSSSEQAVLRSETAKTSVAQGNGQGPADGGRKTGGSAVAAAPRPVQPQKAAAQATAGTPASPASAPKPSADGPVIGGFITMLSPVNGKTGTLAREGAPN